MALITLLLLAFLPLCVAVIAAQNPAPVVLHFMALRSVELPLGWVMVLFGSLGILSAGGLFGLVRWGQPSFSDAARQLQGRVAQLEQSAYTASTEERPFR